jgi:MOSC domain-containing protein YiiM
MEGIVSNQGRVDGLHMSPGGVPKLPIGEAVVTDLGIAGDGHNWEGHGGPLRALCLFSTEVISWLQQEGHPIAPGFAGENVTIGGLDWASVRPGRRYRLGAVVEVEITEYTTPCSKITGCFSDGDISRILQSKHPGESRVYAKVLRPGTLRVGDPVAELD